MKGIGAMTARRGVRMRQSTQRLYRLGRVLPFALVLAALCLLPDSGQAQALSVEFADMDTPMTARLIQLFALVTVLGLAPGLLIAGTCFPFMVIVLSLLRQALGVQQTPPNMMLVALAGILTFFVMEPVANAAWQDGVQPFIDGEIDEAQAFERTLAPFRTHMSARVDEGNLAALQELRGDTAALSVDEVGLATLLPAYMLTEIERGFAFGFLIFLPFLVIDIVVSSVLMSMGMIMLPPIMIALPFKLAFFTIADGWSLVATSMVRSYSG